MKIKFYAPSYKRPEKSISQITYPFVKLVVKESEAKEYKKNGNDIVVCPDSAQGNLCRIRNWILDNLFDDADCIIILDDDCKGIGRWQDQVKKVFSPDELFDFCEKSAYLCKEYGFKFWGLNCIMDKGAYREYTPFGTLQYIGGPFQAHLKESEIRYDEALRINFAHYDVKQAEQEGGCSTYRNLQYERDQFFSLQKKWGKDIVKRDQSSKKSFDFNPVLKIKIKGI
jgi:hypothetical protein